MKKAILFAAIAFGALSANATDGKKALTIEAILASKATPAKMSIKEAKVETSICTEKGEFCYPDSSWQCCSGLCVDMACD